MALRGLTEAENAALLSPCHNQISRPVAAFCGKRAPPACLEDAVSAVDRYFNVLDLFY
jgi:hypothetical protein